MQKSVPIRECSQETFKSRRRVSHVSVSKWNMLSNEGIKYLRLKQIILPPIHQDWVDTLGEPIVLVKGWRHEFWNGCRWRIHNHHRLRQCYKIS